MIVDYAICQISIFQLLVSVVEQAGLRLTWSEIPKTGFLASQRMRALFDFCACEIKFLSLLEF